MLKKKIKLSIDEQNDLKSLEDLKNESLDDLDEFLSQEDIDEIWNYFERRKSYLEEWELSTQETQEDEDNEDSEKLEQDIGEELFLEVDIPSVLFLRRQEQTYGQFLSETFFPKFHPLPSERFYPIVAAFSLLNSAAVPRLNSSYKIGLPILFCHGRSGSGKSLLANLISQHYPSSSVAWVYPNGSPTILRDQPDRVCRIDSNGEFKRYKPALVVLDNFYRSSIGQYGKHFYSLLSWEKENSVTYVRTTEGMEERRLHATKIITSVDSLSEFGSTVAELLRRTIPIPCKKAEPELEVSDYDLSQMKDEYNKLWKKENLGKFLEILKQVIKRKGELGKERDKSLLLIAVMVFSGIASSIDEAKEIMESFWKEIEDQGVEGKSLLESLCDAFLENVAGKRKSVAEKKGFDEDWWKRISQEEIWNYIQKADASISKSQTNKKELTNILKYRGFSLKHDPRKNHFYYYLEQEDFS